MQSSSLQAVHSAMGFFGSALSDVPPPTISSVAMLRYHNAVDG
jgi:hypothetical protein